MSGFLTNNERTALQKRTVRAVRQRWAFQDLPVQVGAPCPACGGLYWWITGREPIAPRGYCLNCRPEAIAQRPALLRLVQTSMCDAPDDAHPLAPEPEREPGIVPDGQLPLF